MDTLCKEFGLSYETIRKNSKVIWKGLPLYRQLFFGAKMVIIIFGSFFCIEIIIIKAKS